MVLIGVSIAIVAAFAISHFFPQYIAAVPAILAVAVGAFAYSMTPTQRVEMWREFRLSAALLFVFAVCTALLIVYEPEGSSPLVYAYIGTSVLFLGNLLWKVAGIFKGAASHRSSKA